MSIVKRRIQIIGAGFSGLSLAWYLSQKGFSVDIYERSDRCGGLLGTHKTQFGNAETGANAILYSKLLHEFCDDIGAEMLFPLDASKNRFIFREAPSKWPLKFMETLQFLGRFLFTFISSGKKGLRPRPLETLETWGQRTIGVAATRFLLLPVMQGVYAGRQYQMSATLLLRRFFEKKKANSGPVKYRGVVSFKGGMQELIDQMKNRLATVGVRIHLDSIIELDLTKPTVLCTSAWDAGQFIDNSLPAVSGKVPAETVAKLRKAVDLLLKCEPLPLISLTMFYSKPPINYRGFGCLFPKGSPTRALGVLMNTFIFPYRNKTYNETWMFGGGNDGQAIYLDDSDLINEALESRKKVFSEPLEMESCRITRWPRGLPNYSVGWENALREMLGLKIPNLYFHGNYMGGIGLSQILERSVFLAMDIEAESNRG